MTATGTGAEAAAQWYALRSKPRKEAAAAALLARAGVEVYLPQVQVAKRPYCPPTDEPLFPGYLFGRLNPHLGEIRLAKYTTGILYVVGYGDQPCPVPEQLIRSLRERIASGRGCIWGPDYKPGERVVITSGPLRDIEAIFDQQLSASGRARVLVQMLRRLCRAEVHLSQLRRAGKAAVIA